MEKITMTDSTIAFIGLGLIGGSIARAIRKTRPDIRIMAYMLSLIHICVISPGLKDCRMW